MRYGLLADIHEQVEFLEAGLDAFRSRGVDRIFHLGDVYGVGARLEKTVALLLASEVEGVWGNHDFGLTDQNNETARSRFSPDCLAFFHNLKPRIEFEDCLITHVEPHRDPENIFDLWSFEPTDGVAASFAAHPHWLMLHGHHHRWVVHSDLGLVEWNRLDPLRLDHDRRYLIEVGAVCDGRCGILDTEAQTLIPIDLRDGP